MEKSEDTRDFKVNFTPEDIVNKDFKQKSIDKLGLICEVIPEEINFIV